ncbi:hypothetical protein [Kamptonema sp. UHCC 0994]|uniref:hypothetical protein n=1 Tax=Kamptonema sp. UHCC 0994 TaxID=3031329 RepID=UPI0023B8DB30|nr:hypothetical protein [Kamptonema sp. UHCC 0994]MDF0554546.1 hypothetical protein [Kamptonema sp. UHCC 0994]
MPKEEGRKKKEKAITARVSVIKNILIVLVVAIGAFCQLSFARWRFSLMTFDR